MLIINAVNVSSFLFRLVVFFERIRIFDVIFSRITINIGLPSFSFNYSFSHRKWLSCKTYKFLPGEQECLFFHIVIQSFRNGFRRQAKKALFVFKIFFEATQSILIAQLKFTAKFLAITIP